MKFLSFLTICLLQSFLISNAQTVKKKPNIIVIYTDDMGYADVGAQNSVTDIKTPNIDLLAKTGVRFTNGYVTAPQCSPSRAGLITGRYQQRFDFDTIPDGPLPLSEKTIADRLASAGYVTGQVGKWHLEPNVTTLKWAENAMPNAVVGANRRLKGIPQNLIIPYMPGSRGFKEYYTGYVNDYDVNYNLDGDLLNQYKHIKQEGYRLEIQTKAALEFVKRNHENPFFLYLAYYGPHVPLESTKKYLDRFTGEMPERRRTALAMISAIDDGVGELKELLKKYKIDENTMIIFSSDNGAPLGITKEDLPISDDHGKWDGSLNTPYTGEKGMLAEGGIRVPYIINYSKLPKGLVYNKPVSTLDIAATAIAIAGLGKDEALDGVDLNPFISTSNKETPHPYLYWRFWGQSAIRAGKWKLIIPGNKPQLLFDIEKDPQEKVNLFSSQTEIVKQLTNKLDNWTNNLTPKGTPKHKLNGQEIEWYNYYFGL